MEIELKKIKELMQQIELIKEALKERDCVCGIDENENWSEKVFELFGCNCP
jgi:hypothetical protein